MANKYVDLAVLNLGLNKMATSVANNFSFKNREFNLKSMY